VIHFGKHKKERLIMEKYLLGGVLSKLSWSFMGISAIMEAGKNFYET
jgi:hypothetical protein